MGPKAQRAALVVQTVKNLPVVLETQVDPWVGNIPWRRNWQCTPVFLPGEFHGQRSLVGYCSWDCKESDTAKELTLSQSMREFHNRCRLPHKQPNPWAIQPSNLYGVRGVSCGKNVMGCQWQGSQQSLWDFGVPTMESV